MNFQQTFNGFDIIENPYMEEKTPTIELAAHVNVSDEFRKKTNAWYIKMFGHKTHVICTQNSLIMHPNTLKKLKEALYRAEVVSNVR